ncbi:MAG: DUF3524 domain-containing protein [Gammaproteobacteria bacterium]|nr:DUF3524 domain-containing protein [Gammaproteobacteria bacterium]
MHQHPHLLLLSAYRADSHAAWADWLCRAFPAFTWQRAELPGRHFRWRIRGNPLSWVDAFSGPAPDALVATSMVDLATLRGLHPALAHVPALYYFHENQFAYPVSAQQVTLASNRRSCSSTARWPRDSDWLFNSAFNRDTFLDGVDNLLRRMPDAGPGRDPSNGSRRRPPSTRCPVDAVAPAAADGIARLILWNHRWEYDKAPDLFAERRAGTRGRRHRIPARPARRGRPHSGRTHSQRIRDGMLANGSSPTAAFRGPSIRPSWAGRALW